MNAMTGRLDMPDPVVVDASAFVDLLVNPSLGSAVRQRIQGCDLYVPYHFTAEVFSAIGRLRRAEALSDHEVNHCLTTLNSTHLQQIDNRTVIEKAWLLRYQFSLKDALYIALSYSLTMPLITTDKKLHEVAEVIEVSQR
jgi:predicted nucleic acid-binding protein